MNNSTNMWKNIAEKGTELLLEDSNDPGRMALPLLHFRSAHPNGLAAYRQDPQTPLKRLKRIAASLRDRAGSSQKLRGDILPAKADVIMVSHLLNPQQGQKPTPDHYYGTLSESLTDAGFGVVKALIDQTGGKALDGWTVGRVPRVVLRNRLNATGEAAIARALAQTAKALRRGSSEPELRTLATQQALSGVARQSLRIAHEVGELVARLRPQAVVFTYEGHAWERSLMQAVRKVDPAIRCIAVHHAILAPLQHAMVQRFGYPWDPDHILAAGTVAEAWLRSEKGLEGIPISRLGSPRTSRAPIDIGINARTEFECLFLPEGLAQENIILAQAALTLTEKRPDLSARMRLHPLVTRKALEELVPELRNAPPNFHWSKEGASLLDDGRDCRWAVYRGSSAVLAAMEAGAEPIYLGDEEPDLRIDPLRGADGLVRVARDADELLEILDPTPYADDKMQAGRHFAQRYYTPLDPQVLIDAITGPHASERTGSNV